VKALAAALFVCLLVTASAATAATTQVLLPGCGGSDHARYKPRSVVVTCGDGGFQVVKLKWSAWGKTSASGTGTAKVNNCKPSCAGGKFESFPVTLTLGKPKTCTAFGSKREFARLTYSFPGKHPAGAKRTGTLRRPCSA
jgi:hypothetical protein